ncbi:hypothetical protein FOC1_g10002465 [Fusarium oxysporum f. sp. cubense race 1]|uniref:Uncharacterized protein n=1 Tax=Fusarium oxysporum f. sp. cubense (strain race 1) TaxID=1229664 RepID=N4UXL7_FUSC1|nr:hypothetical protein FOC1_g10002465 [Fusarium oxysporum f. sp. cubense race 1]
MSTQSTGTEWNRYDLSQRGFFYDDDSRPPKDPLPPHVEALRDSMLDFACEDFDLDSKGEDEANIIFRFLVHLQKDLTRINKSAMKFEEGKFSEDVWESLFQKYFFEPLVQDASASGGDSRKISRSKYYYDAIVFDSKAAWVTFDKSGNALGMEWHKASTPSLVESFSWSKLKKLHEHGLRSSPFHAFKKKQPLENDMKCYPWLVVEHKHKKNTFEKLREKAYCQAVNASGCAVRLNQITAKFAVELPKEAHIPPIPAVTTVGPEVKVWITYFAKDFMAYYYADEEYSEQSFQRCEQGYMMQCIWEGDITNPHDIIKFRLILENTYTWATRVYKPLLTTYIDRWSFAYSDAALNSAHSAMAPRQQKMELSKGLPSIQRETLIQEIHRIISERLETLGQVAAILYIVFVGGFALLDFLREERGRVYIP